jgi:hypothetical protein
LAAEFHLWLPGFGLAAIGDGANFDLDHAAPVGGVSIPSM